MVSGQMSAKTSVAPRSANALAVLENVNDGRITSSPGATSHRIAAISSALEPEVVSSAFPVPVIASSAA